MKLSILYDRLRSRISALIHDLIMIPVAWFAAYLLRFNLESRLWRSLRSMSAIIF